MLSSINEALDDFRAGKVVIVVDNENRENEGDFIIPARHATPDVINFMSKHGRGLVCMALTEERCDQLNLHPMVEDSSSLFGTAFTISVDLIGNGCESGISAHDRAKTVQALIDPATKPEDLARPGHLFPLKAMPGGILERQGHTEATVELARLAGYEPAGVLIEIIHEDGTMARLPELRDVAKKFDLKIVSIDDLVTHLKPNKKLDIISK